MSKITTHILDTSRGRPAASVEVVLERLGDGGAWARVGEATTDANGRISEFPGAGPLLPGMHRLRFGVGSYFSAQGVTAFFPMVEIVFVVKNATEHHHVPLLLSPFGYTTYRGS